MIDLDTHILQDFLAGIVCHFDSTKSYLEVFWGQQSITKIQNEKEKTEGEYIVNVYVNYKLYAKTDIGFLPYFLPDTFTKFIVYFNGYKFFVGPKDIEKFVDEFNKVLSKDEEYLYYVDYRKALLKYGNYSRVNFLTYQDEMKFLEDSLENNLQLLEKIKGWKDSSETRFDKITIENRIGWLQDAISRKINIPIRKPKEITYKTTSNPFQKHLSKTLERSSYCTYDSYISLAKDKNVGWLVATLIYNACLNNGIPMPILNSIWKRIIQDAHQYAKNPLKLHILVPQFVYIYASFVFGIDYRCYYKKSGDNFLVDFFLNGSCSCQCGTYLLYILSKMFPDPNYKIIVVLDKGHIKLVTSSNENKLFLMETTSFQIEQFFKPVTYNDISKNLEAICHSEFVLSLLVLMIQTKKSGTNVFGQTLGIPEIKEIEDPAKFFQKIENIFFKYPLYLADVDMIFLICLKFYGSKSVKSFVEFIKTNHVQKDFSEKIYPSRKQLVQRINENIESLN